MSGSSSGVGSPTASGAAPQPRRVDTQPLPQTQAPAVQPSGAGEAPVTRPATPAASGPPVGYVPERASEDEIRAATQEAQQDDFEAAPSDARTRRPAVAAPPAAIPLASLALGSDVFATSSADIDGDGAVGLKELEIAFAKLQAAFQKANAFVGEGDLRIERARAALAANDAALAQLARTAPRTAAQEQELQRLGAEREVIATDLQELEARKQAWQGQVDAARADAARLQVAAAQLTGGQTPEAEAEAAPVAEDGAAPPAEVAADEPVPAQAQRDAGAVAKGDESPQAVSAQPATATPRQQEAVPSPVGAAPAEAPEPLEEEDELGEAEPEPEAVPAREEPLQAPPPQAAARPAQPVHAAAQPPDAPVTATPDALVALQNTLREAEEKIGLALARVRGGARPAGEVVDGEVVPKEGDVA